jgi:hypothetical protein
MKPAAGKVRLSSPVAESAGDCVEMCYWIKVGLPRDYLPLLRQLAAKLGYKKAPVAAAARALVLIAIRETVIVDAWIWSAQVKNETLARSLRWTSEHSGLDIRSN